jgi:hypothetical protein
MVFDADICQAELDSSQSAFSPIAMRAAKLRVSWTSDEVIVDHACRLHECVADRRADEFESASQQIAAHGVGFSRSRRLSVS